MIGKIKTFFMEVIGELKKVSWSSRRELVNSAWVVIVSSTFIGVYIFIVDSILANFIDKIFK